MADLHTRNSDSGKRYGTTPLAAPLAQSRHINVPLTLTEVLTEAAHQSTPPWAITSPPNCPSKHTPLPSFYFHHINKAQLSVTGTLAKPSPNAGPRWPFLNGKLIPFTRLVVGCSSITNRAYSNSSSNVNVVHRLSHPRRPILIVLEPTRPLQFHLSHVRPSFVTYTLPPVFFCCVLHSNFIRNFISFLLLFLCEWRTSLAAALDLPHGSCMIFFHISLSFLVSHSATAKPRCLAQSINPPIQLTLAPVNHNHLACVLRSFSFCPQLMLCCLRLCSLSPSTVNSHLLLSNQPCNAKVTQRSSALKGSSQPSRSLVNLQLFVWLHTLSCSL